MWKKLDHCYNISDLRELAKCRLPTPIFNFMDGAAETEYSAQRNTAAFDQEKLIPKCLVDVSTVKTSIKVLGQDIEWPVFCSPTGGSRLFHPDGELAVARATAGAGTLYCLSVMSTHSLEDVAAATSEPGVFQLYMFRDRDVTRELIERCKRAGYSALCLTVDCAVAGNRERDLRTGFRIPPQPTIKSMVSFARHPRWLLGQAFKGPLLMPNVAGKPNHDNFVSHSKYFAQQLDPSVTWKDVRNIADIWGGPFVLKGIMCADDARRAADNGATAVMISNHGGRQLDGAASPIEVLPDIVKAVGDQIEVILDGGIRRGSHVLKALVRGAKACSIGRPYLFGLAAGGEAGVTKSLYILRSEFTRAMALLGCSDVKELDESFVRRD